MVGQAYPTIAAIILAAGRASRMGKPKQLLEWQGVPLVRRAAQAALEAEGIGQVIVVTGAHADEIKAAIDDLDLTFVDNPDYMEGMSTSIKAGIHALSQHVRAAMIMLSDQPYVTTPIIERLIETYLQGNSLIVAPVYGDQRGSPVTFDRTIWAELLEISGDQGGREVIRKYHADATFVHFADGLNFDIDTPEDYRTLQQRTHLP